MNNQLKQPFTTEFQQELHVPWIQSETGIIVKCCGS